MKWILLTLVAVVLLGFIAMVAVSAVPVLQTRTPPAQPTAALVGATAPRPVPTDPPGATVFQSIGELERTGGQLKSGQAFRLTVRQNELTERVRRQLAGDPSVPIRDVTIVMRPGVIILSGKVTAMGLTLDTVATGEPVVTDGRALIVVKDVDVGRMPVPGAIKTMVTDTINRNLGPDQFDVPAVISSVDVSDGQMVIRGRSR